MARITGFLFLVLELTAFSCLFPVHAGILDGVGAIGDGFTDEYQFYSWGSGGARNWLEQLATKRFVNFGRFTTADRGLPRAQGYEARLSAKPVV